MTLRRNVLIVIGAVLAISVVVFYLSGRFFIMRGLLEEENHDMKNRLQALFETSPEAIFLETTEGDIVDCNEAAVKMLGYSKAELLRMNARDVVPEDIARSFPRVLKELAGGELFSGEAYNKKKGGELIPVNVSIKPVEIKKEKMILVVVRDMTAAKQTQEELQKRVNELEEFHDLTVGRELKMMELEKEVNGLLRELGREPKYKT